MFAYKVLSVISAIFVEVDFVRFATRMRSSCHVVFKTIEAAQGATACNQTVLFGRNCLEINIKSCKKYILKENKL